MRERERERERERKRERETERVIQVIRAYCKSKSHLYDTYFKQSWLSSQCMFRIDEFGNILVFALVTLYISLSGFHVVVIFSLWKKVQKWPSATLLFANDKLTTFFLSFKLVRLNNFKASSYDVKSSDMEFVTDARTLSV